MSDLPKALVDIGNIRLALAAGTIVRGLGPMVVAATGIMALATATAQVLLSVRAHDAVTFVAGLDSISSVWRLLVSR